ncbi:MAG TPA: hypothetical protein VM364_15185 [Vicinamibacterales bacterium]|nr:hypothetical protein [Vicinamibacterales bacterium]
MAVCAVRPGLEAWSEPDAHPERAPAESRGAGRPVLPHATDLTGLRATLLDAGVTAGEIGYPDYLPAGQFCVTDPDGYTLMIAQSVSDTP